LRDDFLLACAAGLDELLHRVRGITLVVGHPRAEHLARYNSVSVVRDGRIAAVYDKAKLPNYTVFDEQRYFDAGREPCVFTADGERARAYATSRVPRAGRTALAVNICADAWDPQPPRAAREAGAKVLVVVNASPYHVGKHDVRLGVMRERAAETGLAIVYVNLVGGQDEFVFDGASFVMDADGRVTQQLPAFVEALEFVDTDDAVPVRGALAGRVEGEAEIYRALELGLRDYVLKNRFPGALVGLSGDVDSALTLAIAADALGAARVRAVLMPAAGASASRLDEARATADALGVSSREIGVGSLIGAYRCALGHDANAPIEPKIESRIRATLLMALANESGAAALATGNKSALATGDATLYGDTAGGFAVLKDIDRPLVAKLVRYRNRISPVIPRSFFESPPGEGAVKQNAADAARDAIVEAYVEEGLTPAQIVARGYALEDVERVVELVRAAEYKRRQAPIGVRITSRAFGKDWRYPITNGYRHRLK
jgi:NAD+ synthetase